MARASSRQAARQSGRILTINSGSSSIKFAVYEIGAGEELLVRGALERIGQESGTFHASDGAGRLLSDQSLPLPRHDEALHALFNWLHISPGARQAESKASQSAPKVPPPSGMLRGVGHRIVHGGTRFHEPQLVSESMLATLVELFAIDPTHLPHEHAAILAIARIRPDLPQVGCFDTAFHRDMPPLARRYALPHTLWDEGIRRYGFHGLSYEFIMDELERVAGANASAGRIIIAHLGNGASMAAVAGRKSVDTTMGFSPLSGLAMGTRCGDLDPAAVLFLLAEKKMSVADVNSLLNTQSGLLGVSGTSSDMHDLLQREAADPHAALAVDLFCYQAAKHAAALAVALGGLDTLVFTGGIGEHAAPVRARICSRLEHLGVRLDAAHNDADAPVISSAQSAITVRVMRTNEELMIARHTHRLLERELQ